MKPRRDDMRFHPFLSSSSLRSQSLSNHPREWYTRSEGRPQSKTGQLPTVKLLSGTSSPRERCRASCWKPHHRRRSCRRLYPTPSIGDGEGRSIKGGRGREPKTRRLPCRLNGRRGCGLLFPCPSFSNSCIYVLLHFKIDEGK